MSKPRVAIFDFACCEGCQLQIVNLEEEILDLLSVIEPVEWREAMSEQSDEYDIAIVEGSITRKEDEERLKTIRSRASVLVALGACATTGGVNKLKNNFEMNDVKTCVYGEASGLPHLETMPTKAVHEIVPVDFKVHGCPINNKEFGYIVRCIAIGKRPLVPSYPVCVDCKKKGNECLFEDNRLCLGPLSRAGCDAPCPTARTPCLGCRGYVDEPNVNAAKDILDKYGKTVDELKSQMFLFGSKQEHTL